MNRRSAQRRSEPPLAPAGSGSRGRRWWGLRLAAVLLSILVLVLVEVGLRLAGFGYPTNFLIAADPGSGGSESLVTNPRFGWRFFPRAIARGPVAAQLTRATAPGKTRIVVLGGSAAMGTPDADFGLAAQLEVMFQRALPEAEVEVVNAAMAAVGSHVVREIAQDVARLEPDLVVVYLGNNEVVGPYGPASAFARYSPSLAGIRAALVARELRLTQLVEGFGHRLGARAQEGSELARWRGMEMFLDQGIPATDPRLERVSAHLAANLEAIVAASRDAGAAVVVSTVAVDLLDTPPFASMEVTEPAFVAAMESVDVALTAGDVEAARRSLDTALAIEDGHALATWLLGRLQLAGGELEAGRQSLARARDLDLLRFRADTRVNETVREVARHSGVILVDAEQALAAAPESQRGAPGQELFWEHVHLTPIGTYRLAEAIFRGAATTAGVSAAPVPTSAEVFGDLGLTAYDLAQMARAISEMTARPPFIAQYGHAERQRDRRRQVVIAEANARARRDADRALLTARVEVAPSDPRARRRLARHLGWSGETQEATAHWSRLLESASAVSAWRTELALSLVDDGRPAEGVIELERVLAREAWSPGAWTNLGLAKEAAEDLVGARLAYQEALEREPWFETAHFSLAALDARAGDNAAALARLRELSARDPGSSAVWLQLAVRLDEAGDAEEALEAYDRALSLDPQLSVAHNNRGGLLEARGDLAGALEAYQTAAAADPFYPRARFNLADLLLGHGDATYAVEQYQLGLSLEPGNLQARRNLIVALEGLGRVEEAAQERVRLEGMGRGGIGDRGPGTGEKIGRDQE